MVSAEGLSYEGPEASASLAFATYKKDAQRSFFLVVRNQENLDGHQHRADWNVDVHIRESFAGLRRNKLNAQTW